MSEQRFRRLCHPTEGAVHVWWTTQPQIEADSVPDLAYKTVTHDTEKELCPDHDGLPNHERGE